MKSHAHIKNPLARETKTVKAVSKGSNLNGAGLPRANVPSIKNPAARFGYR